MSAVVAASTVAGVISLLYKPLHELTEDDISQLTREDCRQYLKDKGMRRPSWNKSQAIQQVISLKSLLEPPPAYTPRLTSVDPHPSPQKAAVIFSVRYPDPTRAAHKIFVVATVNSSSSAKEVSPLNMEDCASLSEDEGTPEPPVGLSCSDPPPGFDSAEAAVDHRAEALRDADISNFEAGQMAIFYCGKVNVYDGVSAEKAHAVTQLAASPSQSLQAEPNDGSSARWGSPGHFTGSSFKLNVTSADTTVTHPEQTGKTIYHVRQYRQEWDGSREAGADGQKIRQISLQRYLEKKKDRERFKHRGKIGSSSSGSEMYLNQKMRTRVVSGRSSPSGMSSPSQPGQSLVQCGSIENQSTNAGYAADLYERV